MPPTGGAGPKKKEYEMSKEQYPEIFLDEYLNGGPQGYDFDDQRIDDLYDADAIIDYDDDGFFVRLVDLPKYDKYSLKKLGRLRASVDKTKSFAAITEYESYAQSLFHDRNRLITSSTFTAFVSRSKDLTMESKLKFELATVHFQEFWEHFAYATILWLDLKCASPELFNKEDK